MLRIAASIATFITPQFERKWIRIEVSGSPVSESRPFDKLRAGSGAPGFVRTSAGMVLSAIFSSPEPWASRIRAVSLRASVESEAFSDEDQFAAGGDDDGAFAGGEDLLLVEPERG